MVILKLYLDNILSFDDFNINFTYPRKINSLIKDECLESIPSFRYKKVNIFVGSNATGKTSLCKILWSVLAFIKDKERKILQSMVTDTHRDGFIEMDFINSIENQYEFVRLKIKISPNENESIKISCSNPIILKQGDTYEGVIKRLEDIKDLYLNYLEVLNTVDLRFGYIVYLPSTEPNFNKVDFLELETKSELEEYEKILNAVFKTLDPSIVSIRQSLDTEDAYAIKHQNGKTIIAQKGASLSEISYLSSGTKYGFNIANMIYSIKKCEYGIYIMDEQFSYVNSDIEKAVLSTMISLIGPDKQLFFTTHNSNILSIGLPFHSFYFMKKNLVEDKQVITVLCGSEKENRNNVSPKNLYDNDAFATTPILDLILNLGEEDGE